MATWKSNKVVKWSEYTGFDYADCENSWEYGTVSDSLKINTKVGPYSDYTNSVEASERNEFYSKERALALLETLLDWAYTYEGDKAVSEILDRVKKDKS